MNPKLIIMGDCHTFVFRPCTGDIVANFHIGPVTMDAFGRDNSTYFGQATWLLSSLNTAGAILMLSVGEIDIRSHFWRDIPLLNSRGMSGQDYMKHRLTNHLNRIERMREHFQLQRVVIWGPPASCLATDHNADTPTCGSNPTRNALTHLANLEYMRAITANHPKISFASMFYHMIADNLETMPAWVPDTVHIPAERRNDCLALLAPVISGTAQCVVGDGFRKLKDRPFQIAEVSARPAATPHQHYRRWVKASQGTQMEWNGTGYALRNECEIAKDSDTYIELALV